MKSRPLLLFFFPTLLLVFTMVQVRAQQDTSSALPLGLWGIWVDNAQPPLNGGYTDWSQEVGNFSSVGGNYLVGCIPRWTEDSLMLLVEPLGYKVDINRSFGIPDTSLRDWIFNTTHDYVDDITWRAAAGRKVRGIYNTFVTGPGGGRPGFYTY